MLIRMLRAAVRVCGCYCAILLAVVGFGATPESAVAQSQAYSFSIPPVPAGTNQFVGGMNDKGEFVGSYVGADGYQHGFLYSNGQFTTIDVPGVQGTAGLGTVADAVNDEEQVVGRYVTPPQGTTPEKIHGFLWQAGQITLLPDYPAAPGSFTRYTQPFGINNAGAIVGSYTSDVNAGFLYAGGVYTQIQYPNIPQQPPWGTNALGINDSGQIVGNWAYNPNYPFVGNLSHAFLLSGGQYSTIDAPGCSGGDATSINNAGTIIVSCGSQYFLVSGSTYQALPFQYPNASSTVAQQINNQGWILGYAFVSNQLVQFVASPAAALVDPVPDLMSTAAPTTLNDDGLARAGLGGRVVQGIGADGTAEVIVRIPAANVGDEFTVTLMNDQGAQSNLSNEDGALGNPGDATFSQSQVTVKAIAVRSSNGQQVPMAFAVYRAPVDFARQNSDGSYDAGTCNGATSTDDNLACRSVTLQIQNTTAATTADLPITILRPPVVMVHGLWDNWQTWNTFSPLVTGPNTADSRFSIGRASYDFSVGQYITGSVPSYSASQLKNVKANSLGFAFNAPYVLSQINGWINSDFKQGKNPLGIAAAGVQADVVAHSMGGDITRTILLQPTFLSNATFGQGSIHKVITIDTPHLGSLLATQLTTPQETCLQHSILAPLSQKFVFNTVTFSGGGVASGAVADLSPASVALSNISAQGSHPLPTALVAGVYTDFQSLQTSLNANAIFLICGYNDPLAQKIISPAGWQAIFGNQPNDAIVPLTSQLDGLTSTFVFQGFVHSPGTENLGFSPPSVLDPAASGNPIPISVIGLLNTPLTGSAFQELNP